MNLETLRSDIPALEECTYFNWGASGPSPAAVVDAAADFERYHQYESPTDEGMYAAADEATERTREAVAGLLGTDAGNVGLTQSTVDGINHVATGLDWNEGDVVVRTDTEHSAARLPWERMAEEYGLEIRVLDCPEVGDHCLGWIATRELLLILLLLVVLLLIILTAFVTGFSPGCTPNSPPPVFRS
jgi:selenocysteine lyase/cysteine desulfurase